MTDSTPDTAARRSVSRFRYWRGRWRLSNGYCPLCYSSPPRSDCPVCKGTYDYGPQQSLRERHAWRIRFEGMRRG